MGNMKTPGVYIVEKNAFGNSVVEAETAIPAFIGITDTAHNGNDNLTGIPWKISSMTEYLQYFGGAPKLEFTVDIKRYHPKAIKKEEKIIPEKAVLNPKSDIFQYDIESEEKDKFEVEDEKGGKEEKEYAVKYAFYIDGDNKYTLYYNMMLFFANGGSTCYVVSAGSYGGDSKDTLNVDNVEKALTALKKIEEVTMIIVPEAVENAACTNIQQQMLKHCGEMANRFTILDISPKYPGNDQLDTRMETFQGSIGSSYMSYGAAYFPWLNTSVLGDRNLTGDMFTWSDSAYALIDKLTDSALIDIVKALSRKPEEIVIEKTNSKGINENKHTFKFEEVSEGNIYTDDDKKKIIGNIDRIDDIKNGNGDIVAKKIKVTWSPSFNLVEDKQAFHQALLSGSFLYKQAIKGVKKHFNRLPPSAAMAGIYTMVDNSRGVWEAPANVTLNYVDSVTEEIDDLAQAALNVPTNGKAINVIRPFRGEGIKVWGARTLDGNSLDWRYINVRRTLLFLEESVKNAARAYVFEPNDAGTWINMKCMIENFLRSVWKRGGLAGATPEDAFEVHVGLGDTMTAEDILNGIMRITVLVAVTHPAEFIEITFQQQVQKS